MDPPRGLGCRLKSFMVFLLLGSARASGNNLLEHHAGFKMDKIWAPAFTATPQGPHEDKDPTNDNFCGKSTIFGCAQPSMLGPNTTMSQNSYSAAMSTTTPRHQKRGLQCPLNLPQASWTATDQKQQGEQQTLAMPRMATKATLQQVAAQGRH